MKGKYLLLLNNQIRFDQTFYGAESIKMESRIRWISISHKNQLQFPFEASFSFL